MLRMLCATVELSKTIFLVHTIHATITYDLQQHLNYMSKIILKSDCGFLKFVTFLKLNPLKIPSYMYSFFFKQLFIIFFHIFCSLIFIVTRTSYFQSWPVKSALDVFLFLSLLLQPVPCLLFYKVLIKILQQNCIYLINNCPGAIGPSSAVALLPS